MSNKVISKTDATGRKLKTIVRAAGATIAWQTMYHDESSNTHSEYLNFEHYDASGLSYRSTTTSGTAIYGEGAEGSPAEFDPLGGNVGLYSPYISLNPSPPEPENPGLQPFGEFSPMRVNGQLVSFTLDGLEVPAWLALAALNNGSAAQCPNNNCGAQVFTNSQGQSVLSSPFQAYADGTSGYNIPVWLSVRTIENDGTVTNGRAGIIDWVFRQVSYTSSNWNPTWQTRQREERKLTDKEVASLKKELADSVTPECANFLSNFFRNLAEQREDLAFSSKNAFAIFELFKDVASYQDTEKNFGFFFGSKTPGSSGRMPINGKPNDGKSMVSFQDSPSYTNFDNSSERRVGTLIHELIHIATRKAALSHEQMYDLAFQSALETKPSLIGKFNKIANANDTLSSIMFNSTLEIFCKGGSK